MPVSFRFRPEWLQPDGSGFTWRSALALVSACKASYLPGDHAARLGQGEWSMDADTFEVNHSQGLILENDSVTVVAFRGTDSTADWLGNIKIAPRIIDAFNGSLHDGFLVAYEEVADIVANAVDRSAGKSLWFSGHSLGGALAVIAALNHKERDIAGIMTFGQPRLLGKGAAELVNQRFGQTYQRFVNRNDIVTRIPPGYRHAGTRRHFSGSGNDFGAETLESFDVIEQEDNITQLGDTEFDELQTLINDIRSQIPTYSTDAVGIESTDFDRDALLDVSVEGIIPGVSAHKIDNYLAEINMRASAEVSMQGLHETFMERRVGQFSLESTIAEEPFFLDDVDFVEAEFGIETAGDGRGRTDPGSSYLVRIATHAWAPPAGVTLKSIVGNIASVSATSSGVENMRLDPLVLNIDASRDAGIEDVDQSVPHVKGNVVHKRSDLSEKGSNAIVGVIDTGIDILHEAFNDAAGNTRILGVWLQRDPTGPSPKTVDPDAFTQDYGTLYLAKDIEKFRKEYAENSMAPPRGLRDEFSGHGTHVASIAAGRAFDTIGDGMAPEAKIVVVSAHNTSDPENPTEPRSIGYSSSHVDALSFLKRVSLGRTRVSTNGYPMAINVSLGMNAGAHDGQTTLEAAFDGVTGGGRDPGLLIVKSAGNERNYKGHASVQAALGAIEEIVWNSERNSRRRDYLEAWYEPGDTLAFTLVTPLGAKIGPVDFDVTESSLEINGNFYHLAVSEGHSDNGHNRLAITIERRDKDIPSGSWRLEVDGQEILSRNGIVHIWAERIRQRSIQFENSDRRVTLSVPGTANSVVTVGACNSSFPMRLAPMSSQGLTRDGRPKPELCAPGQNITAALAGGATDAAIQKSGTSMAAPHVTGAVALVFSARAKAGLRQVNAVQLQQKLRLTTQNFSRVHNPGFGFGVLDAEKLFNELT